MIGGSYTGGISFFKGLGDGRYAAAKPVLRTDGKPLDEEAAQAPCLGDWDGDGDWDMVVGFIQGPVKLFVNDGKFRFSAGKPLTAAGKRIGARDGGPCITDWDGDGILDLLVGDGEGNIHFYQGKEKGSIDLAAGTVLIKQTTANGWDPRKADANSPTGFSPAGPGVRVKPYAADWNGDGKLDLLVGDFIYIAKPGPELTAEQKKELARLEKKSSDMSKTMQAAYERLYTEALKKIGKKVPKNSTPYAVKLTKAEQSKLQKIWMDVMQKDKTLTKMQEESYAVYRKLGQLKGEPESTGLVWVYLRK
jgi:hypothetical protein